LLRRDAATYRREQRILLEQLEIPRELLDAVDLAAPLDLDGEDGAVRIAAQDVDRADRRRILAAYQSPAGAQGVDMRGKELLQVRLHAVLDQSGVGAKVILRVRDEFLDRDDQLLT